VKAAVNKTDKEVKEIKTVVGANTEKEENIDKEMNVALQDLAKLETQTKENGKNVGYITNHDYCQCLTLN
jgi:hypothetical protein